MNHQSKRGIKRRFKGFDSLHLRIIAVGLLACGMLSSSVVVPSMGSLSNASVGGLTVALVLEAISWCSLPVLAWLLVAWLMAVDTPSDNAATTTLFRAPKMRGFLALAITSVVAEIPYDFANSGKLWDFDSQNPAFALLIAMVVLISLDLLHPEPGQLQRNLRAVKVRFVVLRILVVLAGIAWMMLLNVDLRLGIMRGGALFLLYCLVFRYLAHHENTMMLTATLAGLVGFMIPSLGLLAVHLRTTNDNDDTSQSWRYEGLMVAYVVMLIVFAMLRLLH